MHLYVNSVLSNFVIISLGEEGDICYAGRIGEEGAICFAGCILVLQLCVVVLLLITGVPAPSVDVLHIVSSDVDLNF